MSRRSVLWACSLALLVAVPGRLVAQDVMVGVKGGINLAEQSFSSEGFSVSPGTRTAFVGGGFAQFGLGPALFIQPEALFSSKGWSSDATDAEGALKLDYLEVPLLVGLEIPLENSSVTPSVFAGPDVGFKLGCDLEGIDCGEAYNSVDFGLVFGAGLAFQLRTVAIVVDGRYGLGLTNTLDTGGTDVDLTAKNRAWQFMAGFGFSP